MACVPVKLGLVARVLSSDRILDLDLVVSAQLLDRYTCRRTRSTRGLEQLANVTAAGNWDLSLGPSRTNLSTPVGQLVMTIISELWPLLTFPIRALIVLILKLPWTTLHVLLTNSMFLRVPATRLRAPTVARLIQLVISFDVLALIRRLLVIRLSVLQTSFMTWVMAAPFAFGPLMKIRRSSMAGPPRFVVLCTRVTWTSRIRRPTLCPVLLRLMSCLRLLRVLFMTWVLVACDVRGRVGVLIGRGLNRVPSMGVVWAMAVVTVDVVWVDLTLFEVNRRYVRCAIRITNSVHVLIRPLRFVVVRACNAGGGEPWKMIFPDVRVEIRLMA